MKTFTISFANGDPIRAIVDGKALTIKTQWEESFGRLNEETKWNDGSNLKFETALEQTIWIDGWKDGIRLADPNSEITIT